MKRKILIIDDDRELAMITSDVLEEYGYEVHCIEDCKHAFELLTNQNFQLILLDINLPDGTGFDMCKELRKVSKVPVIFASARTSESDKITGLDIGGDDYLAKPYSLRELLSRVNALMRRAYGSDVKEQIYTLGTKKNIQVNIGLRSVIKDGQEVKLSLKEFDVLSYLCRHANQVSTKEDLLHEVWGAFCEAEMATVAVHIRWLREKLEETPGKPKIIKTIWGIGYQLTEG